MIRQGLTIGLSLLLIGGCVQNVPTGDVLKYRKLLDGPHATTAPADFDSSAPLSLRKALAVADADNEAIGASGENYIQALADKMRQAGNFLPSISLAPTYSLSHGGESGFIIGGTTTGTGTTGTGTGTGATTGTGSAGTGGTVQLTSGNSNVNHTFQVPVSASATGSVSNVSNYQAAGATAQQRELQLLDERETILLDVVQSYYNVLTYEQQVRVYEHSLDSKSEKVRDQQARQKLGAGRPLDVAQSEADLASTEASLTQAHANAANARSALARLMGVSVVDGPLIDAFDPPQDLQTVGEWRRRALEQRQDLRAAQAAVESARLKVAAAIEEYFPTVTINFNYFLYNDPSTNQRWTGALSGTIPIFSALAIESDVRSAWSVYRQAGLTQSQTRRQAVDDVNENFQNLMSARQQIGQLTTQVNAAQQAVDLAGRAYRLGSESNLDFLTQQDSLLTAQLNLVDEQFTAKSSYFGLLRACGELNSELKQATTNP